jgi:hypothetical protein
MVYRNNTSIIYIFSLGSYVLRNNTKKNEKMEGNAYVNVCTGLRLVSNLQIGEIARKFEIGELVSKIGGKI